MISEILKNSARIIFLLLVQGLIINRLDLLNGMILPQLYIFAIFMLPIETPRLAVLVIAAVTGLIADMFTGTPGMHLTACLVMGFILPLALRLIAPREGYDFGHKPTVQSLGMGWYLRFVIPLLLVHHFILFYLEVFRFSHFFTTLLRVILSSSATLALLLLGQYLIFSTKLTKR